MERELTFTCLRIYDMRRFTGNPRTDAYIVGYHLQRDNDTHTLCGYKTDTWRTNGRWTVTTYDYFADLISERDTICFRCLRLWSVKNQLAYPRPWMVNRFDNKETKTIIKRGEKNE